MAVLLDTDHPTILQRQSQPECGRLAVRLGRLPADDIAASIVSFQEQMQGWMAYLNRARSGDRIVHAYAELEAMWRSFCKMNVLSFTGKAQDCFAELRRRRIRIATQDLRIASIALATDSILLTRNVQDFRQVPDLEVEDWTK